jgi:hypothetical protein
VEASRKGGGRLAGLHINTVLLAAWPASDFDAGVEELPGQLVDVPAAVGVVGPNDRQARKTTGQLGEELLGAIAVVQVCWLDLDGEEQPARIDQNMPLAAA